MRINEITGEYFFMEQLSPEVQRAQRMAELEQLAKYRALKLQKIKDWSDPVKRAETQAQYAKDEAEDRAKLKDIPAELVTVRTNITNSTFTLSYITKPKLTLFQRMKLWLTRILSRS